MSEIPRVEWNGGEVSVGVIAKLVSAAPFALFGELAGSGKHWNASCVGANTVPVQAVLGKIRSRVNGELSVLRSASEMHVNFHGKTEFIIVNVPDDVNVI